VSAKRSSKKLILFVKGKDIFVRTVVTLKEKNAQSNIIENVNEKATTFVVVRSKVNFVDNPELIFLVWKTIIFE
jgi:hypothetical protein